ncbi:MAG: complex I subunit 1 family protein [bacterium]
MKLIFNFFIFPGFLFSAGVGLLASYIDRKVTARVQYRQGPPVLQPVYDIIKLFGKELIVPYNVSVPMFLAAPLLGLVSLVMVSTLLGNVVMSPKVTFLGDLIVVIYLLTVPSLAIILGGFTSANPLASLGAGREIKLILAYELPFILAIIVPIIKSGGNIQLGAILSAQAANGIFFLSWSGFLAFVVALLCIQAKLGLVPFDMAEAETEIMGGALIEYSGPALGIYKLTKAIALFVLPLFLIVVFLGGVAGTTWGIVNGILKYVGILVAITLIRNTNPRVRADQALRFFWGPMTVISVIAVVLALLGL